MPVLVLFALAVTVIFVGFPLVRVWMPRRRQYLGAHRERLELRLLIRAFPTLRWQEGLTHGPRGTEPAARAWFGGPFGGGLTDVGIAIRADGDTFRADLFGRAEGVGGSPVEAVWNGLARVFCDPMEDGPAAHVRAVCQTLGITGRP